MSHLITRIASFVLAFGFFISCSTLLSNKEKPKKSTDNLSQTQIQKRLDTLDQQIASGKDTPNIFYQKGLLLARLAQKKKAPSDRTSIYRNVFETFKKAEALYPDSTEKKTEKIQQLLKVSWSNEHNQGVQILQKDSTLSSSDYQTAAAHFKNATIIIPDSSISYKMEAQAYYKDQQMDKAITVLEEARNNVRDVPDKLLEQLAFLYSETKQPRKAITIYKQIETASKQNLNMIHGLANAYIAAEEHQQAVGLLEMLIKKEPGNVIYQQTLATELYSVASQQMDTVTAKLRNGSNLKETNFETADSLLSKAEQQFKQLVKENPEDLDIKRSFATFYQNSASEYQQLLPRVNKNQKTIIEEQITQSLSSSIPLLEELVKKKNSEKSAWEELYQAYTYLGMKEKAANAKSKF